MTLIICWWVRTCLFVLCSSGPGSSVRLLYKRYFFFPVKSQPTKDHRRVNRFCRVMFIGCTNRQYQLRTFFLHTADLIGHTFLWYQCKYGRAAHAGCGFPEYRITGFCFPCDSLYHYSILHRLFCVAVNA